MIHIELKAKVVAVAWGTELFKFLATLAILHHDDFKKKDEYKITGLHRRKDV